MASVFSASKNPFGVPAAPASPGDKNKNNKRSNTGKYIENNVLSAQLLIGCLSFHHDLDDKLASARSFFNIHEFAYSKFQRIEINAIA